MYHALDVTVLQHLPDKYHGKLHLFENKHIFYNKAFVVRSYEKGVLTIDCLQYEIDILGLDGMLTGMFYEESNASSIMSKYLLGKEKEEEIEKIKEIIVTAFNIEIARVYSDSSGPDIVGEYFNIRETLKEKCAETPEYREHMSKIGKEKARKEKISKMVKNICNTTKFLFKDERLANVEEFIKIVLPDGLYDITTIKFAMRWAKLMQYQIGKKNRRGKISQMAEQLAKDANFDYIRVIRYSDGKISDQYLYAIAFLSESWKYGEELRLWHNRKYGYDGEGVINPYYEEDSQDEEYYEDDEDDENSEE